MWLYRSDKSYPVPMKLRLAAIAVLLSGCIKRGPVDGIYGPMSASLPLYTNPVTRDKVFVEVTVEGGRPLLFLLDTGSSLSAISRDLALELGLRLSPMNSQLVGVGGSTPWVGANLSSLRLGRMEVGPLDVAVGVKGVPTHVGLVPLDGILGVDVLHRFQVEVDYPGQQLRLWRPGTLQDPDQSVPLFFDGQHPKAQARVVARSSSGQTVEQPALLDIDTGATGILLLGPSTRGLERVASEESVMINGVGSEPGNGPSARVVPVVSTALGGVQVEQKVQAQWITDSGSGIRASEQMPGLIGHAILRSYNVIIDFPAKRFALVKAVSDRPPTDVHDWYIQRGQASTDPLEHVRALLVMGRGDEARARLERLASRKRPLPGAVVLLARLERQDGHLEAALNRLSTLPVRDVIEAGEILPYVNGLWLSGRKAEAIERATMATVLTPNSAAAWLALADASLAGGAIDEARRAVHQARTIEANPYGHLIRRGVIADLDGDADGALANLQRHLQIDPRDGYVRWLAAAIAAKTGRQDLVTAELEEMATLLNPAEQPLDFVAGAWHILALPGRAMPSFEAGLQRDCGRARSDASRQNCEAWYQGLVGKDLTEAESKVRRALEAYPNRAEFLDTLAVVLAAKGDLAGAKAAAWAAAQHAPDDTYLLMQAVRFQAALATR